MSAILNRHLLLERGKEWRLPDTDGVPASWMRQRGRRRWTTVRLVSEATTGEGREVDDVLVVFSAFRPIESTRRPSASVLSTSMVLPE